ncbi:MAG TPA: hypothetical protein VGN72_12430 [Tepidisphaeraceae bacterium]|jgi:autotransporter-associated beta strand protein|nr:hypothetical protein [Tepidisphaeraceae bacterium]
MQMQSRKHTVGYERATATLVAAILLPTAAHAALETRAWVGNTDSNWNTNANWSPASAPLAPDRIAVFDSAAAYQPSISTHVTVIGGIWMTGSTVNSIEITSNPLGQNSGAPTFQTNGSTINGVAGVGILMDNTSSGDLTINTSAFKLGGTQSWINNSTNRFTLASPANLNGNTVTIGGSGASLLSGALTNSTGTGAITKVDGGTLTLASATISYNGATTINGGTLLVTGTMSSSAAAVVANDGTLGGTGKIARPATVNADATLAPGTSSSAPGTLTFDRNLTLLGATAFDLFNGSGHDTIAVNSTNSTSYDLAFGGTLQVDASGVAFAAGQTYDLFDWTTNTGVSGTFSSIILPTLADGLSWRVYDGGQQFDYATGQISVETSVVPEPLGLCTLGLAGMGLLLSRRRSPI